MAQVTSAKDKNFLGPIAMDLKMDELALTLMTTSSAVEIPGSFTTKLEQTLKVEKMPARQDELRRALKLARGF